ncbi:MAG: hypothetical protein ACE1YX_04665 [Nitrosopumilaceae archaeon]
MSSGKLDLQSLIFQMAQEAKKHETKDYVGHCVVCIEVVDRRLMVYDKNRLFHRSCFDKHGSDFPDVNSDESTVNAQMNVDLVKLRNLKARTIGEVNPSNPSKTKTTSKAKRRRIPVRRRTTVRRRPKRRTKSKAKRRSR